MTAGGRSTKGWKRSTETEAKVSELGWEKEGDGQRLFELMWSRGEREELM